MLNDTQLNETQLNETKLLRPRAGLGLIVGWLACAAAFLAPVCHAQVGDVTVAPRRIVLEGSQRSAQVALMNRGATATTYRILFTQMRMTETGKLESADGSQPWSVDRLIRYSPRRIVLAAGSQQTVRLFLRKPSDLPPGEYRSHLLFQAEPPADAGIDIERAETPTDGFSSRLIPIYSLSIPVIVRHGELKAEVSISSLRLEPESHPSPAITLDLHRRGERSVYGDLTVRFTADRDGTVTVVGKVNGVAVYTPTPRVSLRLPLHPPDGISLTQGRLQVTYATRADEGGEVLAQQELTLP